MVRLSCVWRCLILIAKLIQEARRMQHMLFPACSRWGLGLGLMDDKLCLWISFPGDRASLGSMVFFGAVSCRERLGPIRHGVGVVIPLCLLERVRNLVAVVLRTDPLAL